MTQSCVLHTVNVWFLQSCGLHVGTVILACLPLTTSNQACVIRMNILYNVACQWQMAMIFGQKTILPSCLAEYLGKFVVAMIGCHKTNFPCCVFVTSGGDLKWKFECCQYFFFWEMHCPVQVHTSLKSLLQWVIGACEPPI